MLPIGTIVKTNYGTGPYKIMKVTGPCTCSRYLHGSQPPSPQHYHFKIEFLHEEGKRKTQDLALNAFAMKGKRIVSVWNPADEIFIVPPQLEMFRSL